MYTVGRDANYPESASLCFDPCSKSDYGSVPYNHLALMFRNATGMLAKDYLWKKILEPIGFGEVLYMHPVGMGDYYWACSGQTGPRMTARDYARLAYLMLKEGRWNDRQIFPASWLKKFTASPYPNIRSNVDGFFGSQYPADMFRTGGSGMNWAYVIPSLDLVAVRTSRCYESWDEHRPIFLEKLFASVSSGSASHEEKKLPKMEKVQRFGVLEKSFSASGDYSNPYTDIEATAAFSRPDGSEWNIPLFWDGESIWKLRISPDAVGKWSFSISSSDPGLDGNSGEFECIDSALRGGIMSMDGFPYHFQYQDGTPFWFMGDTGWALYTDNEEKKHDRPAVEEYINTRSQQGFNIIHSMMISEAGWGNSGGDAFNDLESEEINPAYWQEVDERLSYLNEKGITGGLVLAWSDKGANPNDWREFSSQEARLRYARYIIARYSAFDVYFVVAGEWNADIRNNPELTEEQIRNDYIEIGEAVKDSDPHNRMIAIHPGGNANVREFATESWNSFGDYQQTYRPLHGEALASRKFDKPVINAEYAYYLRDMDHDGEVDKHNSFDIDTIRHATWDIVMAGGYFVTGFGNTYFGGNRNPGIFDVHAAQNDVWEEQVQHVKTLFTELEWWRLAPCDESLTSQVQRSQDGRHQIPGKKSRLAVPPETTYWALSNGEGQYVIYIRGLSTQVKLMLGDNAGKSYHIRQFNPRNGQFSHLDIHQDASSISYTPPDQQDWVLILQISK